MVCVGNEVFPDGVCWWWSVCTWWCVLVMKYFLMVCVVYKMFVPDGAGGRGQGAHEVSDVIWDVNG